MCVGVRFCRTHADLRLGCVSNYRPQIREKCLFRGFLALLSCVEAAPLSAELEKKSFTINLKMALIINS